MTDNLSNIIKEKTGKNCYMEEIEYVSFLKSVSIKIEELKAFCSGAIIHDLINIQSIISNQIRIIENTNGK